MRPFESKVDDAPPVPPTDKALSQFREKLLKDGWFKREIFHEVRLSVIVIGMWLAGMMLAWSYPIVSIILLAVAMQQAGWLGHDMDHSRDNSFIKNFAPVIYGWINGFDNSWWSDKHNTHHALTNHKSIDPDINNQPVLFLWPPPKSLDTHLRRYQHLYFVPIYSSLYLSWRLQSIQWAISHANYSKLVFTILPSYIWLSSLPWAVSISSLLLAGWLVAMVVTVSHESEELLDDREISFARTQFRTTRDVVCPDFLSEFLFGGMQYQLIHHLFPTLPRYKYSRLVPLVKIFAQENGLKYKSDGIVVMFTDLYNTLKKNALAAAINDDDNIQVDQ